MRARARLLLSPGPLVLLVLAGCSSADHQDAFIPPSVAPTVIASMTSSDARGQPAPKPLAARRPASPGAAAMLARPADR